MHDKQRKVDGVGWVDPDQKDRTGKPRIVTLHGCARATFNTCAKDARGYGHKAFPRDLREVELRSSLRNFESQNEYGYKPCIKRRFQNAETLQSRNQTNSS